MIDRMVFTAAAAARNAESQLAVTTNNLANADTPGFREQLTGFRAVPVLGQGAPTRVSSVDTTSGFSSTPGRMETTGNPWDLALEGNGWFAVQRADGSTAYTRAGRFTLDAQGIVRTVGGSVLLGQGGPLRMPLGSVPEISGDGMVYARQPDDTTGVAVGQLRIVGARPGQLDRGPDGLYQSATPLGGVAPGAVHVHQGVSESSNVSVSDALVQMISQSRMFDLSMQFVHNADQNAQQADSQLLTDR